MIQEQDIDKKHHYIFEGGLKNNRENIGISKFKGNYRIL
jgi:hypothetical protein